MGKQQTKFYKVLSIISSWISGIYVIFNTFCSLIQELSSEEGFSIPDMHLTHK